MRFSERVALALGFLGLAVAVGPPALQELGVDVAPWVAWAAAVFAGICFLVAIVLLMPIIGRFQRPQRGRTKLLAANPVLNDIPHKDGCPKRTQRLEASTAVAPGGGKVRVGHCLDCGERAYRLTTRR